MELLEDLPGYEKAISTINSALKETAARRQELVETWVKSYKYFLENNLEVSFHIKLQTNEVRKAVISKELSLDADGAVVELTGASMMRVTYDPRLTQLVREVRALAGQGLDVNLNPSNQLVHSDSIPLCFFPRS